VDLEQDFLFQFTGLLAARLDYFFRFWYAIIFIFYLGIQFGIIFQSDGVIVFFSLTACIMVFSYLTIKIRYRKKKSKLSTKGAILFYTSCRCCGK